MSTTETPEAAEAPRAKRITQTYVRTAKPKPDRLTGQGLQVLQAIEDLNCPFVADDVVEKTKGSFKTRQPDERIVGYYLAKFKRQGLLVVEGGKPPADAETPASEEIPADDAE
jgi:hypothetical protein